jgi:hypothetical protein
MNNPYLVRVGEVESAFFLRLKNFFELVDALRITVTDVHRMFFETLRCTQGDISPRFCAYRREKVTVSEHSISKVYIYRFFVLFMVRITQGRPSLSEHQCSPLLPSSLRDTSPKLGVLQFRGSINGGVLWPV